MRQFFITFFLRSFTFLAHSFHGGNFGLTTIWLWFVRQEFTLWHGQTGLLLARYSFVKLISMYSSYKPFDVYQLPSQRPILLSIVNAGINQGGKYSETKKEIWKSATINRSSGVCLPALRGSRIWNSALQLFHSACQPELEV